MKEGRKAQSRNKTTDILFDDHCLNILAIFVGFCIKKYRVPLDFSSIVVVFLVGFCMTANEIIIYVGSEIAPITVGTIETVLPAASMHLFSHRAVMMQNVWPSELVHYDEEERLFSCGMYSNSYSLIIISMLIHHTLPYE